MDYWKLIAGIVLIVTFSWLLTRSSKRYGMAKALVSVDIILGLLAGLYLVITSILSVY